ncbi:MAG: 1,4-dihydroxy-2-naphthoate octaprenyltransferase [Candidatus Eisenbacteria bacterium]|nr:1,4-dihydroxy-2-naphthoate octaprenyltransferase [Candidatus Eisenbacteria bacterium]
MPSHIKIVQGVKLWIAEARVPFLTASIVPVILGSAIAWTTAASFNWGVFWLTMLGGVLLHAGTNIANDYFDHKSGNDEINTEYVRPFTGGSRMIQQNLLTPRQVITGAFVCFIVGSIIGLYLAWLRGWPVLLLGAIGVFSGYFYTAPPFKLAHRGVGEIFVGMNFGILMTLGAYFVQTGSFSLSVAFAGIPVSLLIAAVLYINQFPDYNADKAVGKNHLVVRLGRERAVKGYEILMMAVYASIVIGVVGRILPVLTVLALLTFPMAMKAVGTARKHYADSAHLAPANAATVLVHLLTGLLLSLGYLVKGLL